MSMLLPLAVERGICIITNMGAGNNLLDHQSASSFISVSNNVSHYVWNNQLEVDPLGAQQEVLDIASKLGLSITTAAVYEVCQEKSGLRLW